MGANGAITGRYDRSLAELFLAQLRRHADRPAIADVDGQLSYAEFGSLAQRFARGLRHLGLPEGAVVAVAGGRGRNACVAMLGAVCAGITYMPLDPSLPVDRQRRMLADSGSAAVVRLPDATVSAVDGRVLEFADVLEAGASNTDGTDGPTPNAAVPAYVMFTSGTTGRPKAVAVPQRGVARLALDNGFANVEPTDRVLHAASLSFDTSTFEMWTTLLGGACLVPVTSDVLLSAPALHALLARERISVLLLTTSVFHNMAATRPELFAGLRYAITAGEAMRADAARRVLEHGRPAHRANAYALTEIACISTAYEVTHVPPDAVSVPIGVPISDTTCYVVRSDGSLTGDGEDGELCLGGGGNATGYVNQPEESAARFVSLPVGPEGAPPGSHVRIRNGDAPIRGHMLLDALAPRATVWGWFGVLRDTLGDRGHAVPQGRAVLPQALGLRQPRLPALDLSQDQAQRLRSGLWLPPVEVQRGLEAAVAHQAQARFRHNRLRRHAQCPCREAYRRAQRMPQQV
jgi:amino acid adenylation domain-containing protein